MRKQSIAAAALAGLIGAAFTAPTLAADNEPAALKNADVAVTVNGEQVTVPEMNQLVDQRTHGKKVSLNPSQRRQFAEQVVNMALLAQQAEQEGLGNDPEVVAEMQNTRRLVLARAMIQKMTAPGSVPEADLKKAYEDKYGNGKGGKTELKASHILVKTEKEARDIIKQLDNGGDFAKLAKEHSIGPTGKKGGELGWFAPDQMVPVFAKAAQKLDKGSYTEEPVQTRFGWHVIKLEDTREAKAPTFDEVKDKLREQLAKQRVQQRIKDLRDKADVSIKDAWTQADAGKNTDNGKSDAMSGDKSGGSSD